MQRASHDERVALVALLQTRPGELSWSKITERLVDSGSAADVWNQLVQPTLTSVPGERDPLTVADQTISSWDGQGLHLVTLLDADYPEALRGVQEAPPFLFTHGKLDPHDTAVAVVGSRRASEAGLAFAGELAAKLADSGLTVTAGLARGIDTAAHKAALSAGGRTVAVLPNGITTVYPRENHNLKAEIGENGLLISQFFPDASPQKHTFLMRNATMSGYSLATVVVEAGEHSGSRAQARMANAHGRPVIITRHVVDGSEWGRDLSRSPGVWIADSPDDVIGIVHSLIRGDDLTDSTLRQLVEL